MQSMMAVIGGHERGVALFFHRLRSDRKIQKSALGERKSRVVSPQDRIALPQHRADGVREKEERGLSVQSGTACGRAGAESRFRRSSHALQDRDVNGVE